jgi:hypothetical protein
MRNAHDATGQTNLGLIYSEGKILGLKLHLQASGTAIGHQKTLYRIVNPNRIDR